MFRRRRRIVFAPFIVMIIILGSLADAGISLIISLVSALIPLALIAGIIFLIVYAIKNSNKNTTKKETTVHKNTEVKTSVSTGELNKIDKRLSAYFKKNISLPVLEGITLTTQNGKFTTTDQLYISYKDEKVIKLGEFKQINKDVYQKILQLLMIFSKQKEEDFKEEVVKEEKNDDKVISNNLSQADSYIEKIDRLNDAIPQAEITNSLYQTCDLLKQIDVLKKSNSDEKKIQKLYDYYLPLLTSVLENYKNIQNSPVKDEEFKNSETQLIKTIVLINEALKTICAELQEDDYMNINADIETLQSLLEKDGYGDNPFKGVEK